MNKSSSPNKTPSPPTNGTDSSKTPISPSSASINSQYPHCYLNQNQFMPNYYNHQANNYYWQQYNHYQQNYNYYHQFGMNTQLQNTQNNPAMFNQQQMMMNSSPFQNNPNYNKNQSFQRNNNQNKKYGNGNYNKYNSNDNIRQNYNQNNNNNINNNKKKNKVDKRDLPENNKFYCEVCDRGFKTEDKYKEHISTHTTFHATGIDKKLNNLQTSDDIKKYIDERKKNFPSTSNVNKKTSFEKERESRGIRLNTQQFGKLKHRNQNYHEHKNSNYNLNQCQSNSKRCERENNEKSKISANADHEEGELTDDGDDDIQNEKENDHNDVNMIENNPNYTSFDNAGDDKNELNSNRSNNYKRNLKRKQYLKNKKKRNKSNMYDRKVQLLKYQFSRKPTLLQKLLADEIRHERNILLQCVKYVVENNFFDDSKMSQIRDAINLQESGEAKNSNLLDNKVDVNSKF